METGNLITVGFGLCFMAVGIYAYAYMGRFSESVREAVGVVVEVVVEPGSQKRRMHPVLKFKTNEGKEIVGRSWQHYNSDVGQTLSLLYDPNDPEHVEIGTLAGAWKWRIAVSGLCVLAGLGICFVGIGLESGILNWRPNVYRR